MCCYMHAKQGMSARYNRGYCMQLMQEHSEEGHSPPHRPTQYTSKVNKSYNHLTNAPKEV
jgi:hypothetical protein